MINFVNNSLFINSLTGILSGRNYNSRIIEISYPW